MKCPYCGGEAVWCENKEVYGRNFGTSYMCYLCKPCNAYVGCHNNTKIPLGTMADRELRELRKKAHSLFDPMWKEIGKRGRGKLYEEISLSLGRDVHIGESDKAECVEIINWCNERKIVKKRL